MGVVNTNMPALNAQRNLNITAVNLSKSIERLSSGLRINRAGDDAAGLSISEKLRAQVRGLNQASRNSQDGISLVQTAEGALGEVQSILQRMRELAVQASSDTLTAPDRTAINSEVTQLTTSLTNISTNTQFNNIKLLNGTLGYSFSLTNTSTASAISSSTVSDAAVFNSYLSKAGVTIGTFTIAITSGTNWSAGNNVARITLTDSTSKFVEALDNVAMPASSSEIRPVTFSTFGLTLDIRQTGLTGGGPTFYGGTLAAANVNVQVTGTLLTVQVGANAGEVYTSISVSDFRPGQAGGRFTAMNATTGYTLSNTLAASSAMFELDAQLASVSTQRVNLGAYQNTLESFIANLNLAAENLKGSESRIRDLDVASEMVSFTKTQILQQAGTAVLAQANTAPQNVLQLLR